MRGDEPNGTPKRLAVELGTSDSGLSTARILIRPMGARAYGILRQAVQTPAGRLSGKLDPVMIDLLVAYGLAVEKPAGEHYVKHYVTELGELTVELNECAPMLSVSDGEAG